jgi:hypothetical protein
MGTGIGQHQDFGLLGEALGGIRIWEGRLVYGEKVLGWPFMSINEQDVCSYRHEWTSSLV